MEPLDGRLWIAIALVLATGVLSLVAVRQSIRYQRYLDRIARGHGVEGKPPRKPFWLS